MSHFDDLMKTIHAAANIRGVPALAVEAGMSDDSLRRLLGDNPPSFVSNLRRLEEVSERVVADKIDKATQKP